MKSPAIRSTMLLASLFLGGYLIFSLYSLQRFPPLNFDEIGNMVLADDMRRHGTITYPLMHGVVSPEYRLFTSSGQTSLRSVHIKFLSFCEALFGSRAWFLRLMSFLALIGIGWLLYLFLKRLLPLPWILGGFVLLGLSLDLTLASHLIRPDILIGLMVVSTLVLLAQRDIFSKKSVWLFLGVIAGLAPGVHAHGLIIGAGLLLFILFQRGSRRKKGAMCLYGGAGLLLGLVIWLSMADFATYALSRYSYVAQLYAQNASLWINRLFPWNLLGDTLAMITFPRSFYVPDTLVATSAWMAGGMAVFGLYGFSLIWFWQYPSSKGEVRFLFWAFLFVLFAVGFGHFRPEFVYNVPISTMGLPLVLLALFDSGSRVKIWIRNEWRQRESGALTTFFWTICLSLLSAYWLFRFSFLFYLTVGLLVMALGGASDRRMWIGIGGVVFLLFSFSLVDKGLLDVKRQLLWGSLFSIPSLPAFLVLISSLVILGMVWKRNLWIQKSTPPLLPPLLHLLMSCLLVGVMGYASLFHWIRATTQTESLGKALRHVSTLVGDKGETVMGPAMFWLSYGDRFGDVNGLVLDYFYSGEKKPWSCVERFKPDIVIIDNDIRRRFLARKNPETGDFYLEPADSLFRVPSQRLGVVGHTFHHSPLEVFRLSWDASSKKKRL